MIVQDVLKNGKWLRCVGTSPRNTTRVGSYYAEMLRRCTPARQVGKYSRYLGCTCEFESFQDFATWAVAQPGYGWNLDKDILFKGNKVYSKETCVFVPTELNNLLTKCDASRGKYPIGVSYDLKRGYKVCVSRGDGKDYLGYYSTSDRAFLVYKMAKEAFIQQQADKWQSQIDPRAYDALMNYKVEITD